VNLVPVTGIAGVLVYWSPGLVWDPNIKLMWPAVANGVPMLR